MINQKMRTFRWTKCIHMRTLAFIVFGFTILSCSSDYYSVDDFAHVKKIDTHLHLNGEHLALTEQAHADNFQLLTVNVDVPDYPTLEAQERYARHQIKHFPDRVDFLAAFTLENWNSPNWTTRTISQLEQSFEHGALGIKELLASAGPDDSQQRS
jgi:hypothetical protein